MKTPAQACVVCNKRRKPKAMAAVQIQGAPVSYQLCAPCADIAAVRPDEMREAIEFVLRAEHGDL